MTLTLSVEPATPGAPAPFALQARDAVIGRGAGVDWALADPLVSGRHCEIGFRNGLYLIRDTSTNGTFVNGARLAGIHRLTHGDMLGIGGFAVRVSEGAAAAVPTPKAEVRQPASAEAGLMPALASALAELLATRQRQARELGAAVPDAVARNPLATGGAEAGQRLAALDPASAGAAIRQATDAIERHHAATLQAMAASLRAVLAEVSPDAIAAKAGAPGKAKSDALWRAYVERFNGGALGESGFVDRFAAAFRTNYERLAAELPAA